MPVYGILRNLFPKSSPCSHPLRFHPGTILEVVTLSMSLGWDGVGSHMKQILTILLSLLSLGIGLPSYSEPNKIEAVPVLSFRLPETPARPSATLVVTEIPEGQEANLISKLSEERGPVYFTAKTGDPVNEQLSEKDVTIVSADAPEELPLFAGEKGHQTLEQVKAHLPQNWQSQSQHAPALLVALVPATGFGVYYWVLSSHFMQGAGVFAWELIIASAIGMYTHQVVAFMNPDEVALKSKTRT